MANRGTNADYAATDEIPKAAGRRNRAVAGPDQAVGRVALDATESPRHPAGEGLARAHGRDQPAAPVPERVESSP